MAKSYLNQHQQLRAQQVSTMHEQLRELSQATKEALKLYAKYLASMEKVMSCLLSSSAAVDHMQSHLNHKDATGAQPTAQTSDRLAGAYSSWRTSAELKMMRTELEFLQEVSTTSRDAAKRTKSAVAALKKAAKKCANVNSPEFEAKTSRSSGKKLEKLLREQRERNAEVKKMESSVSDDVAFLVTSCSSKLVTRCEALYAAFASLGHRTSACFPDVDLKPSRGSPPPAGESAPQRPCSASPPEPQNENNTSGCSVPSAYPSAQSADRAATPLCSENEGATSGLQLELCPQEGEAAKA
ncbi:hypothetical protein GH5_01415 [Leishmania sp. Ghana 2012 LV757]|uniref:hypothetical protein n=1 Tax=Leishmania sp. Ghana 2012 LV757 TaxID=2803181 RepID=UPI001B6E1B12|nr:hypothetical protein GH5_01415 [Leishmania sp. Ghana 2012 LV757]